MRLSGFPPCYVLGASKASPELILATVPQWASHFLGEEPEIGEFKQLVPGPAALHLGHQPVPMRVCRGRGMSLLPPTPDSLCMEVINVGDFDSVPFCPSSERVWRWTVQVDRLHQSNQSVALRQAGPPLPPEPRPSPRHAPWASWRPRPSWPPNPVTPASDSAGPGPQLQPLCKGRAESSFAILSEVMRGGLESEETGKLGS